MPFQPYWQTHFLPRLTFSSLLVSPSLSERGESVDLSEHTQRRKITMAAVYKSLSKSSTPKAPTSNGVAKKNKQRVLILSSRGVTYRHRHLLNDLYSLLPHSRKDAKLDTKTKLYQLNELAELYNCNNLLFFEARKGKDLYIWMSKPPNGPTVKMHLQNCAENLYLVRNTVS